ncbi:MAG: twin-arginine translocase subunit TatC [Calditrichota bacterium]
MTDESNKDYEEEQTADSATDGNGSTGGDSGNYYSDSYATATQEEPEEEGMNFLDHLEELRWRLIKSIVGVVAVGIVGYIFSDQLLQLLLVPSKHVSTPFNLQILKVPDMLMIKIKIGVFTGIIGALPIISYQMWKFVAPGLLPHEKQYVPTTVFVITLCFILGGAFGFFAILPVALEFLTRLGLSTVQNNFALDAYVGFVTRMIFITGLVFELPVLSFFLTKLGVITPALLKGVRRYAIVLTFILSAFLTPPDPFSMMLMGVPILLLYEISIWVSYLGLSDETKQAMKAARKKRKAEKKRRRKKK